MTTMRYDAGPTFGDAPERKPNKHAQALGKLGGLAGRGAYLRSLTPEQLRAHQQKAAKASANKRRSILLENASATGVLAPEGTTQHCACGGTRTLTIERTRTGGIVTTNRHWCCDTCCRIHKASAEKRKAK